MLEKDEFLSAEVTGAVGAQRPNAMPRSLAASLGPCGEACNLPVFLQQGGPVEWGAVGVLGPEHLQSSSSPFSFPTLKLGLRPPRHGVRASTGRSILMAETHSFVHSFSLHSLCWKLMQARDTQD